MIRKLSAFILIAFGSLAVGHGIAYAADTPDPHKVPVWTCDTLQFDPVAPIAVTVHGEWDGGTDDIADTYTPDPDGIVTVPISTLTHDRLITLTASLPGIYPGVWTPPVTLDCREPEPPTTTTTQPAPPTPPSSAPPAEVIPPAEQTATPIAQGPGDDGDLATTAANDWQVALVGFFLASTGALAWFYGRKSRWA